MNIHWTSAVFARFTILQPVRPNRAPQISWPTFPQYFAGTHRKASLNAGKWNRKEVRARARPHISMEHGSHICKPGVSSQHVFLLLWTSCCSWREYYWRQFVVLLAPVQEFGTHVTQCHTLSRNICNWKYSGTFSWQTSVNKQRGNRR